MISSSSEYIHLYKSKHEEVLGDSLCSRCWRHIRIVGRRKLPTQTQTSYLCVEEGQTPDSVEGDQHFDQKLFMLRFQRQSETIDYTGRERQK